MQYFTISNGDTEDYVRLEWPIFSQEGKQIKALLDLLIDKSSRNWDMKRKCWFIHSSVADLFISSIRILIENEHGFHSWGMVDNRVKMESFEEFFETPVPSGPAPKTKDTLIAELGILLGMANIQVPSAVTLDEFKKVYRKAALALHPDRNNGDGSRMAELNIVWAELQTLLK